MLGEPLGGGLNAEDMSFSSADDDDDTPSPDVDINRAFSNAGACLREMLRLINAGALAGMPPADGDPTELEQRRIALYSALLLPLARVRVPATDPDALETATKRRRGRGRGRDTVEAPRYVLSNMLKVRAKDADNVCTLHSAARRFQLLVAAEAKATVEAEACADEGSDEECAAARATMAALATAARAPAPLSTAWRVAAAQAVREAGPLWRVARLVALTDMIVTAPTAAAAAIARECDAALGERVLADATLARAWRVTPLLDGHAVSELLPRLPRGPEMKTVVDEQLRWQFETGRGCAGGGSDDDAAASRAHLRRRFPEFS